MFLAKENVWQAPSTEETAEFVSGDTFKCVVERIMAGDPFRYKDWAKIEK